MIEDYGTTATPQDTKHHQPGRKQVADTLGDDAISIYKTGTMLTREETYNSDIDLVVFVKKGFDFDRIRKINERFSREYDVKVGVIGIGIEEIIKIRRKRSTPH